MSAISIRRARKRERDRLAELWQAFLREQEGVDTRFRVAEDAEKRWKNDFPLWIEDETRRIFVAEMGEEVVGFVSAHRWGPPPIYEPTSEVYIDELYVAPPRRGEGVGTELVHRVRDWADELRADRVRFTCLSSNTAAQRFWKKLQATPFYLTMTMELQNESRDKNDVADTRVRLGF